MSTLKDLAQVTGRARTSYANTKPGHYTEVMALPRTAPGPRNTSDPRTSESPQTAPTKADPDPLPDVLALGDNLHFMKALLENTNGIGDLLGGGNGSTGGSLRGKIQMIYLDPPFFTKVDYDAVLRAGGDSFRHRAYQDRWKSGLYEYLRQLGARLLAMRELLADDGLLFLHLDWHASHYAKVMLDDLFGERNFVNEIVWTYKSGGSTKKRFSRKHDTILVYAKTARYQFYPLQEKSYNRGLKPYHFKGVEEYEDDIGWYTMVNMKDVWNIDMVGRTSSERTGYATQKPEQLLRRILACSTKEGDLVADFFCGSGTLPKVASDMGRRFIGCDSGALAMETTLGRLMERHERSAGTVVLTEGAAGWQKEQKQPAFDCRICVGRGEDDLLGPGPLVFRLESVTERRLSLAMDRKSEARIRRLMETDPLALVGSWGIDFTFDGHVFRPDVLYVRKEGKLPDTIGTRRECGQAAGPETRIMARITDVMGRVIYRDLTETVRSACRPRN